MQGRKTTLSFTTSAAPAFAGAAAVGAACAGPVAPVVVCGEDNDPITLNWAPTGTAPDRVRIPTKRTTLNTAISHLRLPGMQSLCQAFEIAFIEEDGVDPLWHNTLEMFAKLDKGGQ
jgi:hypothetical protein